MFDVFYIFIIIMIIVFLVSIYGLCILIGLRLAIVKVFDGVDLTVLSILLCFDRFYVGEGVLEFWKLWLSGKYVVESGKVISNLVVFIFRSEIVFGIFLVLWNSVCGREELKSLGLYRMFGMVVGNVSFFKWTREWN